MKRYIFLFFMLFFSYLLFAGTFDQARRQVFKMGMRTYRDSIYQSYRDSIYLELFAERYRARLDSIWQSISKEDPLNSIFPKKIEIDPNYYKLYLPVTYYRKALMQWYDPKWEKHALNKQEVPYSLFEVNDSVFTRFSKNNYFINQRLFALYNDFPGSIEKWDYKIAALKLYEVDKEELVRPKVNILDIFKPEIIEAKPQEIPGYVKLVKPRLWKFRGNGSLQFSQLHVSDNWYTGGDNNLNLQSSFAFYFNYNNQEYIQFDNSLEIKEGLNTTPSDTVHGYTINTDLFRLTSKLGIKAAKNWYYTLSMQFSSQFFTNYVTNSMKKNSSFLSPGYLSVGIGMDYKLKLKKFDLSVLMSPLAYNLRFVTDPDIEETRYGIERGKYSLNTYGSEVTINSTWKITSYITYTSRLYWFTNYERVETNFENTIDVAINRYFSTRFFSHIRFDDNVKRKPDQSYFQFKDILSFGLSYQW